MDGVNWKGKFIVIPLVWYAVAPLVSSPLRPQYILEENISYVPMNQEEYMNITKIKICEDPNHSLTYVLHPVSNRTVLGCFYKKPMIGNFCPEFNFDTSGNIILQQKFAAPCGELDITPCGFTYNSSESYKLFGCFIVYGGIPSLMQQQQKIEDLKQRELTSRELIESLNRTVKEKDEKIGYQWITITVVAVCLGILILAILIYNLYHFFKPKTRKNIAYSSGDQSEKGRSIECDSLKRESENTAAPPKTSKNIAIPSGVQSEEERSNEDDPLSGVFENITAKRHNDMSTYVDLEVEYSEDTPSISIH